MDFPLFQIINNWANKNIWLDYFMIFCAEYLIFGLFLILVFLFFFLKEKTKKIQLIILALGSTALAWFLNQLISLIHFRQRPFISHHDIVQLVQHASDKSFPSDHTTISFALGFSIFLLNKKIGTIALVCAFFVAFARIFCGLHYPLDIFGGIIMAFCVVWIIQKIILFSKKLKN
ncbi:undecaprenyl-diphosphatase [Candidatus Kuenenbacteria bacterium HGW-Kuenenbacteria-1]|uniref:Undecaprenyl-diphosphatase n=1 Tax=Candidatus Kuenenbacteria bacterium HGW-Kuenenbacteria-1 TaxID=2013812 RepID=A0A2N1UN94_9BACT|nr:MAG: undecaprenyl-diphosphatase [Candidatus Kuenenbacteria bacterium HGW-Kuenenbacteria-1]